MQFTSCSPRRRSCPAFVLVLLIALLGSGRASAQGTSATLNGFISDSTGALIADATVTLKNVATNFTRSAVSSSTGEFGVAELPPGTYIMTVERDGFKTYVQSGIILTVNEHAAQNVVLEVGSNISTVKVTANAELLDTSSAEISSVVNATAVQELPLNGRDPSTLVLLSPGTTNVLNTGGGLNQSGYGFPNETAASANGGRQGSTYYLLDGVPNMDTALALAAPFPNADATQEFRVSTNNFDASYGFSPSAVVTIQTRSGGNAFHGGLFEFVRNNDFNAGNYFTHAVDSLKRNQFGGEIGGPIIKDKLFFFFNYQGTRAVSTGASNVAYTPTAAMLAGDFSAVPTTLSGPFTTVNGVRNQVDPSLFSAAAVAISETGLPEGQVVSSGQINYVSGKLVNDFDEYTARADLNISPRQQINLRTFENLFNQPSGDVNGNILSVVGSTTIQKEPMEYLNEALNHTWTINSSTVNVLSAFWTQLSAHSSALTNDASGQPMCLSRYINVSELPGQCYIEGLSVTNGFTAGYTEPSQKVRTIIGVREGLTETRGNHTLSAGIDVFHQYQQLYTQYPSEPIVAFNGSYTGFGLADFLLGDVSKFTQGAVLLQGISGWQIGPYVQDQYRMRQNLTITAGLRWDPNIAPPVLDALGAAFHPGQQSVVYPNAPTGLVYPGDPGVSDALMPSNYGYWEPRIGFAWQPRWLKETSIRGAFGLFEAPLLYSDYAHTPQVAQRSVV